LFYPGAAAFEWVSGEIRIDRNKHGGARALKQGDACIDCHADETAQMGQTIASGEKLEPSPVPGRISSVPAKIQATHDGENLYLRLTWKQPATAGLPKMDETNPVKVAFMLQDGSIEVAAQSGCWATCHTDAQTMPEGQQGKTKYVKGGTLENGQFFDLAQWRSGENLAYEGYVADQRVLEKSSTVKAEGKLEGDSWSVVFQRKLTGGKGDVTLQSGKSYPIGFAIHQDHAAGRYHLVSLGYLLGLDAEGQIQAKKH
jgi:hypothetical protein